MDRIQSPYLWLGAIILVGAILMRSHRRRIISAHEYQNMTVKEKVARRYGQPNEVVSHVQEYMASMADLSRQINGQIDTRISKLEILLRDADKTIAQLEKLQSSTPQSNPTASEASQQVRALAEQYRQTRPEFPSDEPGEATDTELVSTPIKEVDPATLSPQAREIIQLAEKNLSALDIAKKLDRPVGEIQLILRLAGRKQN